ncbi:helix-turn-helix transcriptional regulator [Rhodospirillum sp. A1_3_36]|uniref:helix-turn-helix transcriptional regulator n=1 Tax=Rhodospirillum sp. A1_3_36 TaxID=3391666 RepID=UPI0039A4222E
MTTSPEIRHKIRDAVLARAERQRTEAKVHETRELKRKFGKHIQALRKKAGLTQEGLAEAIGKSVDQMGNIERGATATRLDTAQALADFLGVSLSDLFSFEERGVSESPRDALIADLADLLQDEDEATIRAIMKTIKVLLDDFVVREAD